MYKYIEVKKYDTDEVVKRLDVSDISERSCDRMDNGLNINLNHDVFFTTINDSEIKLDLI